MSQKANPTLIGAFVFGAILIAIAAAVLFGSSAFFTKKQDYVTYFNQSVSGLGIGSNVKYKGVTVGKVVKVQLKFQGENEPPIVKVLYDIDADNLLNKLGVQLELGSRDLNKRAVEHGFRAKLDFESLISGQLFIALDFYKDAAPIVLQEPNAVLGPLEIPPQPSDIDAILANLTKAIGNLGNVDFLSLSKDLQTLIVSARTGIDALKLDQLGPALTKTAEALTKTGDAVSEVAKGDQLKGTLQSIQGSFTQLTATLKKLDPALKDLGPTLDEAKLTMANLQRSTADLSKLIKPDSGFRYQLDSSLSQISAAADSIQRLSEFLQRHPNSILFGRRPGNSDQP